MKKIIFIIESLHLGGAEKSLVTLLSNLDYSKYSVDLILFINGGVFEKFIPEEVNVIRNLYPKISLNDRVKYKIFKIIFKNKFHNASLFWKATRNCFSAHNNQYDVAIAYSQGLASYYTAAYIDASKKYSWLNIDYHKAGYSIQFDYPFYEKFNGLITVSPEVKNGLENELLKIEKSLKIEVIKDIVDKKILLDQSQQKIKIAFNNNKINIVTAGRLAKQKGMHLAIESCCKLLEKGYELHWYIVGEGSERNYLEKLIKSNNLEDNMTLVGMTDNPYPYMKSCDIYVQTSLFEGLGLTVIEASLLNKPIVSTNFPSVYGIIEHEKTGLIAEMNSASIAKNIEIYLNDNDFKNNVVYNLSILINKDMEDSLAKINSLFQ